MAPNDPTCWYSHLCVGHSHICQGWSVSPIEYIRSDGMSLLKLSYNIKDTGMPILVSVSLSASPSLSLTPPSLSLPVSHPLLSLSLSLSFSHVTCSVGSQHKQGTKAYASIPVSWEMDVPAPVVSSDNRSAGQGLRFSLMKQSQNHPVQRRPDSWPSETVWDKEGFTIWAAVFGSDLLI